MIHTSIDKNLYPVTYNEISAANITVRKKYIDENKANTWISDNGFNYTEGIRCYCVLTTIGNVANKTILDVGGERKVFHTAIENMSGTSVIANPDDSTCDGMNDYLDFKEAFRALGHIDIIYCGHTIEHFLEKTEEAFIREVVDIAKPKLICIEPIFINRYPLNILEDSRMIEYADRESTIVIDPTTNFSGSKSRHMGFGRIYSLDTFKKRIINNLKGYKYELIELHAKNNIPNISKYKYKRKDLNVPLRILTAARLD
ncbi:MAG: hypothetical protein AB2809_12050 [Candidatus Thiodiazotropha sp.]